MDGTGQYGLMIVDVVDGAMREFYLVGNHANGVVAQLVVCPQRTDMYLSVQCQFSGQVDGIQRTGQPDGSLGMTCHTAQETFGERLGKVQVSTLSTDG